MVGWLAHQTLCVLCLRTYFCIFLHVSWGVNSRGPPFASVTTTHENDLTLLFTLHLSQTHIHDDTKGHLLWVQWLYYGLCRLLVLLYCSSFLTLTSHHYLQKDQNTTMSMSRACAKKKGVSAPVLVFSFITSSAQILKFQQIRLTSQKRKNKKDK